MRRGRRATSALPSATVRTAAPSRPRVAAIDAHQASLWNTVAPGATASSARQCGRRVSISAAVECRRATNAVRTGRESTVVSRSATRKATTVIGCCSKREGRLAGANLPGRRLLLERVSRDVPDAALSLGIDGEIDLELHLALLLETRELHCA